MAKDWTGNENSTYTMLGASNHVDYDRAEHDYYSTDPKAAEMLLEIEPNLSDSIWECACGENALSNVFKAHGKTVRCSDLVVRCDGIEQLDFLTCNEPMHDTDIITNPPYKCYDSDTQCYTKRGWLNYGEVREDDEVLSVNPYTMELEWSGIKAIIIRDKSEDEKMYHFKKQRMDIMVTSGHRMFVFNHDNNSLILESGDLVKSERIKKAHYIPRCGYTWKGTSKNEFVLPAIEGNVCAQPVHKKEITIDMNDWLDFFGLWLADGCCRHTLNVQGNQRKTVTIKQSERTADKVREILSKLPFTYKESLDTKNRKVPCINFEIHNEQLWSYLKQFGKSADKFVPDDIKNLTVPQIQRFLSAYFFGDGSQYNTQTSEGRLFRTISKKLAEDIQELLLKTGFLSHISQANYKTRDGRVGVVYIIIENRESIYNRMHFPSNKNDRCAVDYVGKVWCLNLNKNGVFLLRRNGLEFFCGNCALQFVEKALSLVDDGRYVCMFFKLTFLEGKARRLFFDQNPPIRVWVSSSRLNCGRNGIVKNTTSAVCYAWFVWQKGFKGHPEIRWFN